MSLVSWAVPIAAQWMPKLSSRVLASSGYTRDVDAFGDGAFEVWNEATAERQDRAWRPLVAEALERGRPRADIEALRSALHACGDTLESVLEVGCGGGYLSELVDAWYPDSRYVGIDISEAMIANARRHFPGRDFRTASAYDLPFDDDEMELVLDGVALIHMPDWKRALAEYARVAKGRIVLHGLTLTDEAATTRFGKYAYGQPTLEFVFGRTEFEQTCEQLGLVRELSLPGLEYDLRRYIGIPSVSESWVLHVEAPARDAS
ncbi:hypothetical protein ASE14_05450 [Agromyces sp. Root81]|uniref:class I SAM-dependent methyltransferase n=1 Tax=Agromyces sp. Root81 TaxID=1736601 RepID=UPI0006FDCA7D|nr:class I SAM-dependent methyltransferase [Agromyces sp. Root81]KRC60466.1 hypothetical protein ASE14_05450 [Agromyces sp. Root81]